MVPLQWGRGQTAAESWATPNLSRASS